MLKLTEIARLIVVRVKPDLPWCVVDPQLWGAAGAPGETDMLYVMSYILPGESVDYLSYVLQGGTVTLALYRRPIEGFFFDRPPTLRLDGKVTLPVALRRLDGRTGAIARRHPQLEVRLDNRRSVSYPYVHVSCRSGNPPWLGLLLAEPVTLLHPKVDV